MRRNSLKTLLSVSVSFALLSCGSGTPNEISSLTGNSSDTSAEDRETETTTVQQSQSQLPSTLTWDSGAKTLFANNCGLCHSGWPFDLESFTAKRSAILKRIQSTTKPMPPTATAKWINDKEKAIEYLSSLQLK